MCMLSYVRVFVCISVWKIMQSEQRQPISLAIQSHVFFISQFHDQMENSYKDTGILKSIPLSSMKDASHIWSHTEDPQMLLVWGKTKKKKSQQTKWYKLPSLREYNCSTLICVGMCRYYVVYAHIWCYECEGEWARGAYIQKQTNIQKKKKDIC